MPGRLPADALGRSRMKQIAKLFRSFAGGILAIALFDAISTLCSLFMPYLMSGIVNQGIAEKNLERIYELGGQMLLLAAVGLVCALFTAKINAWVAGGFTYEMQNMMLQKINSLTFEEYSSIGTSSLLTRSTDDVMTLQEVAGSMAYALVSVPIMIIGGIVLSFFQDRTVALVMIVMVPLALFLVSRITKRLGGLWEFADKKMDDQNRMVRERLAGLRVIRAFDREAFEHQRISEATTQMTGSLIKSNVLSGLINPVCLFLLNMVSVLVLYVGSVKIASGALLTAGDLIAVVQYIALISNGVLALSWTIAWLPHVRVSLRRINEVLQLEGTKQEGWGEKLGGSVQLSHVSFTYPDSETETLHDVSMDIREGEQVAIIGGTGSGKSTVIKLLLAFYRPDSGEIRLGGKDYRQTTRESIRDNLSVALQKSMIFEGTAGENIRMGKPDATDDEVMEAAEIAHIGEFIREQKEKLNYRLAQLGTNISGGQKQRFGIARTIIKPASVYVFDDSFSALDYLTESRLRRALNRYLTGKTQIIVTQRAATAMRCDRIYVMDQGETVGSGTHEELMKNCRIYQEIYHSQLGGDEA